MLSSSSFKIQKRQQNTQQKQTKQITKVYVVFFFFLFLVFFLILFIVITRSIIRCNKIVGFLCFRSSFLSCRSFLTLLRTKNNEWLKFSKKFIHNNKKRFHLPAAAAPPDFLYSSISLLYRCFSTSANLSHFCYYQQKSVNNKKKQKVILYYGFIFQFFPKLPSSFRYVAYAHARFFNTGSIFVQPNNIRRWSFLRSIRIFFSSLFRRFFSFSCKFRLNKKNLINKNLQKKIRIIYLLQFSMVLV